MSNHEMVSQAEAPPKAPPAGASQKASGEGGDESQQFLTFMLGDEPFVISIRNVKEIIEYGQITPVPMAPPFVRGVMNLRGRVVPVIDLHARFGRPSSVVTKNTSLIITEVATEDGAQDVGMMVDAVDTVLEIPPGDLRPPPAFGALLRAEFVEGVGKVNGRFALILNLETVLSVEEMASFIIMGDAPAN